RALLVVAAVPGEAQSCWRRVRFDYDSRWPARNGELGKLRARIQRTGGRLAGASLEHKISVAAAKRIRRLSLRLFQKQRRRRIASGLERRRVEVAGAQ